VFLDRRFSLCKPRTVSSTQTKVSYVRGWPA
jgi:hypothetical protein